MHYIKKGQKQTVYNLTEQKCKKQMMTKQRWKIIK